MAATLTPDDLALMGFTVKDGEAVRVAAFNVEPEHVSDKADGTWQETQRACFRVFDRGGCTVYWLSQARKTRQTAGLPDLLVFGPPGAPFLLMWETKHGQGKPSEAQRRFQAHCQRTRTHYASGTSAAARRTLAALLLSEKEGCISDTPEGKR